MDDEGDRTVDGYRLKQTCWAGPEQYDVFRGAEQVGYLRLRHGRFDASVPNEDGGIVYEAMPKGDSRFEDDERDRFLREAVAAIDEALRLNP